MTWKDIVKRETMTVNQANEEAHKIMVKRYGKDYEKRNWAGAEKRQLIDLMYHHGMSPAMAAKQPFIEPKESDASKDW